LRRVSIYAAIEVHPELTDSSFKPSSSNSKVLSNTSGIDNFGLLFFTKKKYY